MKGRWEDRICPLLDNFRPQLVLVQFLLPLQRLLSSTRFGDCPFLVLLLVGQNFRLFLIIAHSLPNFVLLFRTNFYIAHSHPEYSHPGPTTGTNFTEVVVVGTVFAVLVVGLRGIVVVVVVVVVVVPAVEVGVMKVLGTRCKCGT